MAASGTTCDTWTPSGLADLLVQREKLQDEIDKLEIKIDQLKGQTLVECQSNNHGKGCGQKIAINKLVYLVQMCYEGPYGCSGGDTWHEGDGEFICPHCKHQNRLYYRPEATSLRRHFFAEQKVYPE